MSDEFEGIEERLRAAQASLAPPPGLQEQIRTRLHRPPQSRQLPWSGFAAAAAVLLAVGGVGFLLSRAPTGGTAGGSSGAGSFGAFAPAPQAAEGFGLLPRPPALKSALAAGSGAGGATADQTAARGTPVAPSSSLGLQAVVPSGLAPVYRWTSAGTPPAECSSPPAPANLGGYQVVGSVPCGVMELPLTTATYRVMSEPSGAFLVYVAVPDGAVGYFEPAYRLPDGSVVTALTSDELRR